jgi:hypothetical protein
MVDYSYRRFLMSQDTLKFRVAKLSALVPEGVPVLWQGKELSSGPLSIELDQSPDTPESHGELDYARDRAWAEFHVRVSFPELAELLESTGVDAELTKPVSAVLRSEGDILEDHSFALSGGCDLQDHCLFPRESTAASVLPGY